MMPTVEEFKEKNFPNYYWDESSAKKLAVDFAKYHVEAALKEAEKETVKHISKTILELNMYNKNSILNAYPLTNIK